MKKSVRDINVRNKRVLVRVDFNVPLEDGSVADDTRIRAAVPTIEYLREQGSRIILCSHLGRPKGTVQDNLRLRPAADRLADLLGSPVGYVRDCVGEDVAEEVAKLESSEVLVLENTRFHPGEKQNDADFAVQLASHAEVYVNDAFAAAHRAHASTEGVARHLPSVGGLLMLREMERLSRVIEDPRHPFVLILGGAKIADKIGVVDRFRNQTDLFLTGGGIANTFLKAAGKHVGTSLVDEDNVAFARETLSTLGDAVVLPTDVVVADGPDSPETAETVAVDAVPEDKMILDVGPKTTDEYKSRLSSMERVLWNGPLGVFEKEPFGDATFALARILAEIDAEVITGGGDSASAVSRAGVEDRMAHVSTGGGAFLEYMEGRELPGIAALDDKS